MASYPTDLPQCEGTRLVPRSGIRVRIASNGTARARALSSAMRYDPIIVHKGLTLTQLQELLAFHESNRGVAFTLTYQPESSTLTCLFADKPIDYQPMLAGGGQRFNATVYMVQAT